MSKFLHCCWHSVSQQVNTCLISCLIDVLLFSTTFCSITSANYAFDVKSPTAPIAAIKFRILDSTFSGNRFASNLPVSGLIAVLPLLH